MKSTSYKLSSPMKTKGQATFNDTLFLHRTIEQKLFVLSLQHVTLFYKYRYIYSAAVRHDRINHCFN